MECELGKPAIPALSPKLRQEVQSDGAARAYIKRRADQVLDREKELAAGNLPACGRPAIQVELQEAVWMTKWAARPHGDARPCAVETDLSGTAQGLRAAVAQMRRKAPGPDGWAACTMLRLPSGWWQLAAML